MESVVGAVASVVRLRFLSDVKAAEGRAVTIVGVSVGMGVVFVVVVVGIGPSP